jgi:hypothetical protein
MPPPITHTRAELLFSIGSGLADIERLSKGSSASVCNSPLHHSLKWEMIETPVASLNEVIARAISLTNQRDSHRRTPVPNVTERSFSTAGIHTNWPVVISVTGQNFYWRYYIRHYSSLTRDKSIIRQLM